MRFNPKQGMDAAELVNRASQRELETLLREFGEERHARRIARAIVARRRERPFDTTSDLAALIHRPWGRAVERSTPRRGLFRRCAWP